MILIFHIALPNECPKRQLGTNHFFCLHYWIPIIYTAQEKGTLPPDWWNHYRHFPSQNDSVMRQRHLKINSRGRQIQESRRNFNVSLHCKSSGQRGLSSSYHVRTNYIILIPSFNWIRSLFSLCWRQGYMIKWSLKCFLS